MSHYDVHSPIAPPPAAPPPIPPPTPPSEGGGTFDEETGPKSLKKGGIGGGVFGSKKKKKSGKQQVVRSYQRGGSLGEAARPTIEHFGDEEEDDQHQRFLGSMQHASSDDIGVNRGVANSAMGSGTTLPELVVRMRIINMTLCTFAILFEIPSFLSKALFNPPRAVLAGYLAFLAGLLCCFELHVPAIARFVRSNFGLLYSPMGRACFLFLMGGLCVGQGGILEIMLGGIMVANGFYTLYIPCKYPGFEKAHEELGRENIVSIAAKRAVGYAWADPEWATRLAEGTEQMGGEREGLMRGPPQ
mmetsp:Transcript_1322/g.3610  ORF Transcript_1322/g.3610 Transcript_1322/m.3610 type:complete len:302 (-) Transcript_1322:255-1160(-)|eukprot:CAMPEP_0113528078 /NCGR_PEP_ID=MMETSP0015_2-20120614/1643_1 /TAXON_ID=2838 /ORGANISM="Odontella" /LENGTH=301 /DNA_ID=CAMNT_0000426567 /DNA_START=268 /DNA_END=1173 /DNA_ORIENTATION=- /assembly_acc=CAM_ASM_000160